MGLRLRDRFVSGFRAFRDPDSYNEAGLAGGAPVSLMSVDLADLEPILRYEVLRLYRENRAYQKLWQVVEVHVPDDFDRIRALENPALQAVAFHVAHVFPGTLDEALPLVAGVADPLRDGWDFISRWGGVGAMKDALVEEAASFGDGFLKAVATEDGRQVYPELWHPGHVWDFREDNRRSMRYLRLDYELPEGQPDEATHYTEVWDKDGRVLGTPETFASWRHRLGVGHPLDDLPLPAYDGPRPITDFGHDFVPFRRVPFRAGARPSVRSSGVFEPYIEAIDHLLRTATNIGDLFEDNAEGVWLATRNQPGENPVEFKNDGGEEGRETTEERHHNRRIVSMPSMSRVDDLVAGIDYSAGLEIESARRRGLEYSLQELRYSRGLDGGDPAAAAIRQDQAPALRRAEALRGNAEEGLLDVARMCFSMMAKRGLAPRNIGSYEAGSFKALAFKRRPVSPETPQEVYERQEIRGRVWQQHANMGTLAYYLEKEEGFEPTEAAKVAAMVTTTGRRARVGEIVNGG